MDRFRRIPSPRAQTVAWSLLGLATALAVLTHLGPPGPTVTVPGLVALTAVTVLASRTSVEVPLPTLGRRTPASVSLDEGALVLLLHTAPVPWAWLVSGLAYGLSQVGRGRAREQVVFNQAVWAVSTGAAALLAARAGTGEGADDLSLRAAGLLSLALLLHTAINYLAVQVVVATSAGVRLGRGISASLPLALLALVGNLAVGLAGVALWLDDPRFVVIVAAFPLLLRTALLQRVRVDELAEDVRIDRDRLGQIVTSTAEGIVLLDHRGTIVVWNPAMADLTGIPPAAALGRDVDGVLDGALRDATDAPVSLASQVRDGADPHGSASLRLVHRDGEERHVEVRHALQHDRLAQPVSDVVQLRDETSEVDVARAKDDFLARVTHELRTPLTAIIGFGLTLRQLGPRLDEDVRAELTDRLVRAAEALERLVDDLLLVSQGAVSGGRTSQRLDPRPLADLVREAVRHECNEHPGRRVDVDVTDDAVAVIDPGWFTTVVRHLVCNALTYSDPSTRVEVTLGRGPDRTCLVAVRDEGRGIPASKLRHLFDRFTRVEDPLRMETRGAGLGLFIVDRLTARMGGHVEVTSSLGEGSLFELHLPDATSDAAPAARDDASV